MKNEHTPKEKKTFRLSPEAASALKALCTHYHVAIENAAVETLLTSAFYYLAEIEKLASEAATFRRIANERADLLKSLRNILLKVIDN